MMMMKVASDTSLPSAAFPNTTLLQLTFASGAGPFSSHLDHDANRDNNRDDHGKGRKSVSTNICKKKIVFPESVNMMVNIQIQKRWRRNLSPCVEDSLLYISLRVVGST